MQCLLQRLFNCLRLGEVDAGRNEIEQYPPISGVIDLPPPIPIDLKIASDSAKISHFRNEAQANGVGDNQLVPAASKPKINGTSGAVGSDSTGSNGSTENGGEGGTPKPKARLQIKLGRTTTPSTLVSGTY